MNQNKPYTKIKNRSCIGTTCCSIPFIIVNKVCLKQKHNRGLWYLTPLSTISQLNIVAA